MYMKRLNGQWLGLAWYLLISLLLQSHSYVQIQQLSFESLSSVFLLLYPIHDAKLMPSALYPIHDAFGTGVSLLVLSLIDWFVNVDLHTLFCG